MTDYVELHCRSAFSFLRGASTPEQLVRRAAELQMPTIGLCDRDGLYGAPRLFKEAKDHGVRPIVGAELTIPADGQQTILPVLVQSRRGYENLCQLLTRAHLRNEKGKCSVGWDELPEFAEGLVALAGHNVVAASRQSDAVLPGKILRRSAEAPLRHVERLINTFGRENVFIELQRHRIRGEEKRICSLVDLAEHLHLPLLATNGVVYASELQRPVLDVFTCIRRHTHLDAAGQLLEQNGERHLKNAKQMRELFRDLPEAINNTMRLAERLDFTLENLGYEFPSFPIPPHHTVDSFLREKALEGARWRYQHRGEVRSLETSWTGISYGFAGGDDSTTTGSPSGTCNTGFMTWRL